VSALQSRVVLLRRQPHPQAASKAKFSHHIGPSVSRKSWLRAVNLLTRAAVSAGEAMVVVAVVTLVRECDPVGVFLIGVIRQTGERTRISQFNGFHGRRILHDVRPTALKLFVLAVIACECE
jgi:hypothetical protein